MDIITAIKSGRPYKRAHMKAYITFDTDDSFSGEDILATDWETEEPKVEIMESEFIALSDSAAEKVFVVDWMDYRDALRTVLFGKKDEQQEK